MDIKSWAMGFIDGEGSFTISSRKSGSGSRYHFPRLIIQVRADDEGSIRKVIKALSIKPYFSHRKASNRTWNSKPTVQVTWSSKNQLKELIKFFTKFPPQSKKAKEYPLWEKAVTIFLYEKNYKMRELEMLSIKEQIQEMRQYKL